MAVSLPTLSSTTGTLSALGVGSGLDLNGLVSKLMTVEQLPLTLLNQQEAGLQAELSNLGSVKGSLSSLQSAAQTLASASTAAYGATVSDSSFLAATADGASAAGSYSVSISKLAQAQKLVSASPGSASTSAAIGTGASTTLTFTLGTISSVLGPTGGKYSDAIFTADATKTAVTVTIGNTNNTLAGIRDAINAANAGVTATIINDGSGNPYRLSLTSNTTGAASSLQLSVGGDATIAGLLGYDPNSPTGQKLSETQTAQSAQLTVDGINITSATNLVAGAIQGVTLNLAKAPTASPVTVTVQRNNSNLISALSALVNAYNDTNKTIGTATAKGAPMQGDWGVLRLENQVRSILGSTQNTGGAYTNLTQLGISFQKDGSLTLDSNTLNTALSANVGNVSNLATAIGTAISSAANNMLGTAGPIASETDGINRTITDIGNRRTTLQARINATQQRYQTQFSALDALISSMNQTSAFLTQQLASLSNLSLNSNKG